eukprot:scaffold4635_cov267-Pinguiococcus_pyrenoidosus.AAC.18
MSLAREHASELPNSQVILHSTAPRVRSCARYASATPLMLEQTSSSKPLGIAEKTTCSFVGCLASSTAQRSSRPSAVALLGPCGTPNTFPSLSPLPFQPPSSGESLNKTWTDQDSSAQHLSAGWTACRT